MNSIDKNLVKMKYRFLRVANLEAAKIELEEHIQREEQTLSRLKNHLDKEQEDVEKLEHASIQRLFSSLKGRNNLRLEKEKAEAFRAELDYKLKQNDIEFLNYQKSLLLQELKQYENIHQEYQGLLDIKRKTLDTNVLNEIRANEELLEKWITKHQEIEDAMEAGSKLRSSFTFILDNLSDLVEDTTDAKSLWYPVISQDQIDDVSNEVGKLNVLWKDFEQQLSETETTLPENFDKEFLVKVTDYFYELDDKHKAGKKINTSFEQLNATYSGVREVLGKLQKNGKEVEYCIQDLKLDIQRKIEEG